jgi:16S rRNA (guanine966-N2)-methyltransferase
MRIISGQNKGKKISQPIDKLTRPLKDLTKESIFNIIKHSNLINIDLKNANILDLFSGVGSFGLECISRGASNVIFFENYINVLKVLKKNIKDLKYDKKVEVIDVDIFNKDAFNLINNKFEIIFFDPPYKEKKLSMLIEKIIKLNLLKENGIFIIHRHIKEKDLFPDSFKILLEKKYGISKIIFGN